MCDEMLERPFQYWLRLGLVILAFALLYTVTATMFPFLVALILAFILLPLVETIQNVGYKRFGVNSLPRWLAIFFAFLVFICITTLLITNIFVPFLTEFSRFVHNIPSVMAQFGEVLWEWQYENLDGAITPQVQLLINEGLVKLGNYSVELARQGLTAALSFAGVIVELLMVPILAFYMLKDGHHMKKGFVSLFDSPMQEPVENMLLKMQGTLGGYLRGQLILACNMFCIVLIAMYCFGLPYPLVLSLLAAIAEWVPIIGPILGATPAIILASLISPSLAVQVALFYMIVQLIDAQIIMPKLMGSVIKLHPIVIIVAIFTGGSLYGIAGMMLAVPTTALLQILVNHLWFYNKHFKGTGEEQ